MKLLVISQTYPSKESPYSQAFIHSRNTEYQKQGLSVDVCAFAARENYIYENVSVFKEDSLRNPLESYDVLIFHAPNLRNHLRFLLSNWFRIKRIVFVFHGYEVMKIQDHVTPYFHILKPSLFKRAVRSVYDTLKIPVIAIVIKLIRAFKKSHFIFVSKHFQDSVVRDLKISGDCSVIHNPVNSIFNGSTYQPADKWAADFITIRPFDEPKYGVDLVILIAEKNPDQTFHIYGSGSYFNYVKVPSNVKIFKTFLEQKDLPALLNKYKYALMPSRWDSQGVMSCEMAVYGMPLLTSDLPVFQEVLSGFSNVSFFNNDFPDLKDALRKLSPVKGKVDRFNVEKTVSLEINIFKKLIGEGFREKDFKILLMTDAYPYGKNESFVHDELKELSKYVDVEVLPLVKRGTQFYRDIPQNVFVHQPVWSSPSILEFLRKAIFRGPPLIHFLPIDSKYFTSFKNLVNFLKAVYISKSILGERRVKEIMSQNFDLIYFYWGVNFAYILPKLQTRNKSIVKFHAYDVYEDDLNHIPFKKEILNRMDMGVFISQDGLDHTRERYPEFEDKYRVCRLGVHFHGKSSRSSDSILRVVSCSNIVAAKRVHLIAEALLKCRIPIHWTHFGDGQLKEELLQILARSKNTGLTWDFKGHVPNQKVREYYVQNPVDLFLNTSDAEGIPVAIMEALSAGIPVLATDAGGTKEIVSEDVGSLLPINFEILKLAELIELHADKRLLDLKSANAFELWSDKLDARKNHKQFFEMLLELKNSNNRVASEWK